MTGRFLRVRGPARFVWCLVLLLCSAQARAQSDAGSAVDAAPPSAEAAAPVAASTASPPKACGNAQPTLQEVDSKCVSRPAPATDEVPDVASLKAPESPAFMAVGTVPSQIQRPTTPMGLASSLAAGVASGVSSGLPRNFALEVAPYWLAKHPDVSFRAWQSQRGRAWYRNASISLATGGEDKKITNAEGGAETIKLTSAAVGLRTSLVPGIPSTGAIRCREFLEHFAEQRAVLASRMIGMQLAAWDEANPSPPLNTPDKPNPEDKKFKLPDGTFDVVTYSAAMQVWQRQVNDPAFQAKSFADYIAWQELRAQFAAQRIAEFEKSQPVDESALEQCLAALHATQGFAIDLAGAYALKLPDADWSKLDENGAGVGTVWLTAGYIAENMRRAGSTASAIEGSILAVLRAQRENAHDAKVAKDTTRLDAGLRFVLAAKRCGAAIEGTLRHQRTSRAGVDKNALLYRVAFTLDYRLAGGMWLSGTFGKDFGATEKKHPLIALANFQWAFDTTRGVSTDQFKTIGMGK